MVEARGVEVRRLLPASTAEVFRWWTEPELLSQWMSPIGSAEAEIDLKVGGTIHIVMRGAGVEIDHRGEYLEIDPPHRLVFTWNSQFTVGASLVTVTLDAVDDSTTRMVIVHTRLPDVAMESHSGGWSSMVDRLEGGLRAA